MDSERGRGTYGRGRRGGRNMRFRGRGLGNRGGYSRQGYYNRENGELNGKPTTYNSYSKEPRSNLTETENAYSQPTSSYRGGRASRGFRSQRNPYSAGQGEYQPRYNAGDSYQGASNRYQSNPRDRDAENEKPREYSHNPSTGYDRPQRGFRSRGRSRPYTGANRNYLESSDHSGYPNYTRDRTQSAHAERAPNYSADRPAESPARPQRGESSGQYREPGPDAGGYRGRGRGRGRRGFRRGYRNVRQNYNGGRSYESKHLTKISALEPMKESLYVNCVALSDPVEIEGRYSRGTEMKQWTVLVGDETGCVDLKIHNSNVARLVKEGVSMTIQNGHIEMKDNRFMRLATYRGGYVSVLQESHVFKPSTNPNYSIVEYVEE